MTEQQRAAQAPSAGPSCTPGAARRVRSVAIAAKLNCAALADLFDSTSQHALVGAGESPKISHLVRPMLNLGLKLHLVTLSEDVREVVSLSGTNVSLTVCPARSSKRVRDIHAFERKQVREALLAQPADVVHAHQTYQYALGALATGLPTLITVRDWAMTVARLEHGALRTPKQTAHLFTKIGMQFATLLRAQHFTANSPYLAQRVRRVVRDCVPVIPNCLPPELLVSGPRALSTEAVTIVAVNRGFSRRKNVKTLLQAFPVVRRRYRRARLILAGHGYEDNGPAAYWAKPRGLAEGVDFVGPLTHDAIIALFDSADLMAHPSREESFGIVLMEAMARGTPVVGGNRSGAVPWVLAGGRAGVLTDINDPGALATAICLLLGDSRRWHLLSEAARQHVRDRFSAEAVVSQYAEVYERVLAANVRIGRLV